MTVRLLIFHTSGYIEEYAGVYMPRVTDYVAGTLAYFRDGFFDPRMSPWTKLVQETSVPQTNWVYYAPGYEPDIPSEYKTWALLKESS